jgi:thioredoxin 1
MSIPVLLAIAIVAVVMLKSRSDRGAESGDFVAVESALPTEGSDRPDAAAGPSQSSEVGDEASADAAAFVGGPPAGAAAITGRPRLVDLGSDKCIPCKMMAPILTQLTEDYAGVMDVEVIDVRKDRTAARRYGIRVIPTQIFYGSDGRELFRHQGFYSREEILGKWAELGVELPGR